VYDTHELETETVGSKGVRRLLAKITERHYVHRADALAVVNEEIATWYRQAYTLSDVTVVRNVPVRPTIRPHRNGSLRTRLGVPGDALLFIYQGIFSRGRGLDVMLESFARESRHHLVLLGYGEEIGRVSAAVAELDRVHLLPAVPPAELAALTAEADVGLALIEDVCLSYRLCLPNKLFEYLNAGLPVVVSGSPAMRRIVDADGLGWVLPAVTETALSTLLSQLDRPLVEAVREAVSAHWGRDVWEEEEPRLLAMYARLGFCAKS
jgi:glycosyltransferase involved in cell wall biosynthesis